MSYLLRPSVLALIAALALVAVGGLVLVPLAPASAAAAPDPASSAPTATTTPPAATTANPAAQWTPPTEPTLRSVPAGSCPPATSSEASCLTEIGGAVSDASAAAAGKANAVGSSDTRQAPVPDTAVPQSVTKTGGYSPADLASLYRVPSGVSSNATVGIVDVGSDPNTAAQLSYYRSYFGLPPCTAANGCFREVGQTGTSALPATDSDWVDEIAMDVQAVSALCPTCRIVLVDAKSASSTDLGTATLTAVRLGATYLSLSYGSTDSTRDSQLNLTYYNSPGVTYVAASGDDGYAGGTIFPSSATNVVAAGGTTAKLVNGVWQQSAWSGGGSGCASTGLLGLVGGLVQSLLSGSACPAGRAVTDVAALADASTGIMFYRGGQWWRGGGTSLATPILTALYALAGNHTDPLAVYDNVGTDPGAFVDIASGSNGTCGTVLCTAQRGWDGPTGVGTPAGLAGLTSSGDAAAAPLAAPTTAGALSRSGSYPVTLRYRLADATTGAPIGGAKTLVQASTGHGFTTIGTAYTGAAGTLAVSQRPRIPTTYRIFYAGDVTHAASTSPSVTVRTFAPTVRVRRSGRAVRVSATAPWHGPAARVPLSLQRQVRGHWRTVGHGRTDAKGSTRIPAHGTGRYRVRYGGGAWAIGTSHAIGIRG